MRETPTSKLASWMKETPTSKLASWMRDIDEETGNVDDKYRCRNCDHG